MSQTLAVFDIDGVVRDVSASYRRALADTVEEFTQGGFRPNMADIDQLKAEGLWNNDWEASQEFVYRHFEEQGQSRSQLSLSYEALVAFFQQRYRGSNWDGYILNEPLLMSAGYLESLTTAAVSWGFFSGATRGSATFVLEKRLGLTSPILIAIFYVGDTVADMQTVLRAQALNPDHTWIGIGVLPPHVTDRATYQAQLTQAGATRVFANVEEFTPAMMRELG
jgi:HAD superfamily phosphatase